MINTKRGKMVKRFFVISILCFSLFALTSCDHSIKTATFYVHNNSQFDVTELGLSPGSDGGYKEILKSGEKCTLHTEWVDGGGWLGKSVGTQIYFYLNGEKHGCVGEVELETADPRRFKPGRWITDGDTITVNIYDDHWEW